jgi:hypothetical protein
MAVCLLAVFVCVQTAWAYDESGTVDPKYDPSAQGCPQCHPKDRGGVSLPNAYHMGPHADYSTMSSNCAICHAVHPRGYHVRSGEPTLTPGIMLLPKPTIKATCETCHDGTGGQGVYGAIAARGLAVGGQHRIDVTNVVPGGNAATGGSIVTTFSGVNGDLSCDDCHNPHNANTVKPFVGDRVRINVGWPTGCATSRLLRRRPTSATTSTADYGSDWCGACHKGRLSGSGMANNHPVESSKTNASPFTYSRVAILTTDTPTATTVISYMGGVTRSMATTDTGAGGNRGFLMPDPAAVRTAQQQGHYPICMQCHEDSRNVGTLSADGSIADAAASIITSADGRVASDNPRFQNFPHETQNTQLLVEPGDDLCTNCHPTGILP